MIRMSDIESWMLDFRRKKKRGVLSCFLCFIFILSFGQIESKIDTAHIKIGEPIQYSLTVPVLAGQKVELPHMQAALSFHVEMLNQQIDTIGEGERKNIIHQLTLTSCDPGEVLVRSL